MKYISVSFEELYARLQKEIELGADPEDREEYKAENVFYVPMVVGNTESLLQAMPTSLGFSISSIILRQTDKRVLFWQKVH